MSKHRVLFVTYDGLLDPLGGSQILPYLRGLRPTIERLHILSFEKRDRYTAAGDAMRAALADDRIDWTPLRFTTGLGPMGKLWDSLKLTLTGIGLAAYRRASLVHARGHVTAGLALWCKRLLGTRMIFDFRGLWVDERVDKGGWNLTKRADQLQYSYFKRQERKLLACADEVVVLTEAVVPEVLRMGVRRCGAITVIPCCADFDLFHPASASVRKTVRDRLGINDDALVLAYLGSVGPMYRLDRFFRLIELASATRPSMRALVITLDRAALEAEMYRSLPAELHDRLIICQASRTEVAELLSAVDVLVSFIQPSYARTAASPTKMAEGFAVGVPTVCNNDVGDVERHVSLLGGGECGPIEDSEWLSGAASRLEVTAAKGGMRLRNAARTIFGLELAVDRYNAIYARLEN